ncbi:GTP-binding protein [Haliangium ochraceum]|uniref:sulfate adenylyltransferase n=1 Tax=Haliangium ochraceum (strain DSM 14365 / JCM 11303 / SMP-2) TaxID=502025 RepID=D0LQA7_HALO1|nr:GTP-binding protein [Haliangium ochraceum]ACY18916.1 sulfate adenylyltransferase, large subunit [Haliangium ochraceum DSM 14365]
MVARETMNVVIVGHVDHGKSTLVGRLLADTGTLGEGKLEKIQAVCKQQGKKFEYAFLLDALEEEQGQGITIDSARVFFRSDRRDYIIIDAPGHIEFLKNMVSGAARAEAGVLLIDAKEGVRENSRRHGYLLSMLGIKQIVVAVNKIDLVDYSKEVFERIVDEYRAFLREVEIEPTHFIPVSAREGDFVVSRSDKLDWFDGPTILEAVDSFEKAKPSAELPLRMPVQDVYKFNERGDDRRIIVGRVESGTLKPGDRVVFSPSYKSTTIESIETFHADAPSAVEAGRTTGFTLTEQIYVSRGEIMHHADTPPDVSTKLRVNLFWLGKRPMVPGRRYKLKLATSDTEVTIDKIHRILDAGDLTATDTKEMVERHDVADLVLRTRHQIAFDIARQIEATGRFVIVDEFDIAGGGIVREAVDDEVADRRLEYRIRGTEWVRGDITPDQRADINGHPASMVMLTGEVNTGKHEVARALEYALVRTGHHAYLLDGKNVVLGVDADIAFDDIDELVRRFGEVAHILLDAGHVVISTTNVIGLTDHLGIQVQISPFKMFVAHLGPEAEGLPEGADLRLDPEPDVESAVAAIVGELGRRARLIPDKQRRER